MRGKGLGLAGCPSAAHTLRSEPRSPRIAPRLPADLATCLSACLPARPHLRNANPPQDGALARVR